MSCVFLCMLLAISLASELAVTKEYIDYLKAHVDWDVVDYERNIFKGWTLEEVKATSSPPPAYQLEHIPSPLPHKNVPSTLSWANSTCDYGVLDNQQCRADWAFAVAGMLSSRCCVQGKDMGWLSPQELISCDKSNSGCRPGRSIYAIDYVRRNGGLVNNECFPYEGKATECSGKCRDGKDWKKAHVCKCEDLTFCTGFEDIKKCLLSGPLVSVISVCTSFLAYKSGIYKCDCSEKYIGSFDTLIVGYSFAPSCYYILKYPWGENWGMKGYVYMACDTCEVGKSRSTFVCGRVTP
eukprot:TRINITY_DN11740_c0_g1_i2.p1 TRINITY_DN11740_c0_g1~~TRINITY_DN11740_c0_g1_i2.p1  ORF type:complete len:295 (+),score=57.09 TRINITY_DN11740_c0_g1_i2:173-1057(+)